MASLRRIVIGVIGAALVAAPISLAAQAVPQVRLKPPDATLAVEFTRIGPVLELRDGRVLFGDGREQRMVVADFSAGFVTQVGRQGNGPGEYPMPGRVWPLRGDSGLMPSGFGKGRWILFDRAAITGAVPPDDPGWKATSANLFCVDTVGHTYSGASGAQPTGGSGFTTGDSIPVVRAHRGTGRADTLARLRNAPTRMVTTGVRDARGNTPFGIIRPPYFTYEAAICFPDGWVAVARLDPYRVDWIAPDGRAAKGTPLPVTLPRVEPIDREALMAQFPVRSGALPFLDFEAFPDRVPPFQSLPLMAAPDGRLWIKRTVTASQPDARHDIVDRRGALVGQLAMPANERIVGFGVKSVYVAWKDDDDIERLRRHPWP